MAHWLTNHGFLTYVLTIPNEGFDSALDQMLDDLDGVVISGGADVSPGTYGESPLKEEWGGDGVRDRYEIAMIQKAVEKNVPVLGICRGHQIINVAFGGTLYQDISTQIETEFEHRRRDIYEKNVHNVMFNPSSYLSTMYGGLREARVNSVHHQAVKELGTNFVVEARSKVDGVIEAIRLSDPDRYVAGVQWHPEFQDPNDRTLLATEPLLKDFERAMEKRR